MNYKNMFRDIYIWFQRNIDLKDNLQDWGKAVKEMDMVLREYPCDVCSKMCAALFCELERLSKYES